MKTFLKHAAITLFLLWVGVCSIGSYFDSICVEGKLTEAQAVAVNSLTWEKCPGYRHGGCEAQVDDRVFVRECSELSRKVFFWRPEKLWKSIKRTLSRS